MFEERYLLHAISLAKNSVASHGGGPFGAVIVKNGKIVGEGVNSVTTSLDCTAHAEMNALRKACENLNTFNLSGCRLYASCEPCPMCLSAIYWSRISEVYYASTQNEAARIGFDDRYIHEQLSLRKDLRDVKLHHHPLNEANALFQMWEHDEEKTPY